jgi:hypothetical protein
VPSRVAFFVWTAALGRILTLDNQRTRQVIVMDCCCMCKKSREFIDHLLLHSKVARNLWASVFRLFWDKVGNALMGGEFIGELERPVW